MKDKQFIEGFLLGFAITIVLCYVTFACILVNLK
jgi:hypothetical protein